MRLVAPVAAAAVLVLTSGISLAQEKTAAIDLAQRVCATCHGVKGISVSPTFPNLASQQAEYLDVQIKAFRDHSRADPHAQAFMWGMAAQLTDPTIKELADYFSSQPPPAAASAGAAEIAAGKKIFEDGIEAQSVPACVSCHGEKAAGQGPVPRLAGQHRDYLERQLEAFSSNLRANEIMHETTKGLKALDISEVAAYLTSRP